MSVPNPVPGAGAPPVAGAGAQQQTAATGTTTQPGADASTIFVSSVDDLKTKAPEVYKAMLEGIMTQVIGQLQDHDNRMKELIRDGQRDNNDRR